MSENIYVWSGKTKEVTGKWLEFFKASYSVTINPDKLEEYIQEFKGHKFVKLNIVVKKEEDQFGKDVSITIDQFEPKEKEETKEPKASDLPF